jgi:hypothetical protein
MKRRYGLESIIGKNSTLRFPRLVSLEMPCTINSILPANTEEIESSFNTALTMKSADPEEAYDQFNDASCEYEDEFPIRVKVLVQGSVSSIEILDPTVSSLFYIAFDLEDFPIEKFRASISDIIVTSVNFALIKLMPQGSYFFSDSLITLRTILNNIMSYNCARKRPKLSNILSLNIRLQRYLLNIKSHINKESYQRRLYHYCYKTLKSRKRKLLPILFDRIEDFYDIFEDWDDAYDIVWSDHSTTSWFDLFDLVLLANEYALQIGIREDNSVIPSNYYISLSLDKFLESIASEFNLVLLQSFKVLHNQE